jgi:hypothetical protein
LQLVVEPLVLAKPPWWLCDWRETSHRKYKEDDGPWTKQRVKRSERPTAFGVQFGIQVLVGSWRGAFVTSFDSILPSDWNSLPFVHEYETRSGKPGRWVRYPPTYYDFDHSLKELGPVWPVPKCHYDRVTAKRREGPSAADLRPASYKPWGNPRYSLAVFMASTPDSYGRTTSDFMQKLPWTKPQIETETTPLKAAA